MNGRYRGDGRRTDGYVSHDPLLWETPAETEKWASWRRHSKSHADPSRRIGTAEYPS